MELGLRNNVWYALGHILIWHSNRNLSVRSSARLSPALIDPGLTTKGLADPDRPSNCRPVDPLWDPTAWYLSPVLKILLI